jgi:hypothetical protein
VGAAERVAIVLEPMTQNSASAMGTGRSQRMNGALERIEGVIAPVSFDCDRLVVLVATYLAPCHDEVSHDRACKSPKMAA